MFRVALLLAIGLGQLARAQGESAPALPPPEAIADAGIALGAPAEATDTAAPEKPVESPTAAAAPPAEPVRPPPAAPPAAKPVEPVSAAPTPVGPANAGSPAEVPAEVRVGDTVVFTIRTSRGALTPTMRARLAADALHDAVATAQPDDVRIEHAGSVSIIYVGVAPIVQLTTEDAARAGDASLTVHADRVAAAIRQALKAEQQRSVVASTIFNVSLAVLFAVLAVFFLRRAWQFGDRAERWLEANPERVPSLRLRTVEVLNRSAVRGALSLAVAAGRWVVLLGLVYAWLIATFSLFEATRELTEKLSGVLLGPLAALASRVAASVPLIVVVGFAALTLALVLRAVRLFFTEVAHGATTVGWLPKDLAAPTGVLVQLGLVVLALILVAPVITGNPEGAFTRMGLVLLVSAGLASVPVVATGLLGVVTLFGRQLKVGDWVELGSRAGRVLGVGLLETTLRDAGGVELKVPHLLRLWNPTRVHGPTPRVRATLTIDRALATPALSARLERVLAGLGTSATVRLVEVQAAHVLLELTVSSATGDAQAAMLWLALAELEALKQEQQ
ncbi:MAG: mechanosensitive ion channel family protein [Myxococcota bacterium]